MKKMVKYLDYFFVLRPTLFFPVWTMALAGVWAFDRYGADSPIQSVFTDFNLTDLKLAFFLLLYTLLMGAVFLLNQIEDVESDKLNNKLFLIANGDISVRQAFIQTGLLFIVPLVITLILRWDLAVILALSFIVMGWMYSCNPLNLKNHPIGGILANFFGGYIVFAFGWMIRGPVSFQMLLHATPYALGMMAVYFFTTIPDVEGDKAVNKVTVAVKYGTEKIIYTGLLVEVLAVISALITFDIVILLPTLFILPFFILSAKSKNVKMVLQTNKFAALFLSLMICYHFPVYFILIFVLFYFSKWYYRARFNIDYPSLRK